MTESSILPAIWDVPQVFRDRLGAQPGRQRAMFADGHLLLVMHEPPHPEDDDRRGRFFWRQPDGTWNSSGLGGGVGAVAKHINEYAERVEQFDQAEERASTADEYFAILESLSPLHRAVANMHRVLQDARKFVSEDRDIINLRDRAYDVERSAELLYTVAKNSLDYDVAKRAEEQAKSSHRMSVSAHRLNLLAAFFFPIATLTAIFGMNLATGLEDVPPPVPLFVVLIVGVLCGAVLTSFVTKEPPPV